MEPRITGWRLAEARRDAGLTQTEVAARMGTTQSAVSRVESGRSQPTLDFVDRYARAIGRPITIRFGAGPDPPTRAERQARVRRVLGDYVFDPWERNPSPVEAQTLLADGLTRDRFRRGRPGPSDR